MGYGFNVDPPGIFGPGGVTSSNALFEFDSYADWKFYKNFTLSLVGAFADPHKAVQEAYNRASAFKCGMVYIAYSF